MRLSTLMANLRRKLSLTEIQTEYSTQRLIHPGLTDFRTLDEVFAKLRTRDNDPLVRCLVTLAQQEPERPLWIEILVYRFLPSLIRIRARTIPMGHEDDEIDAILRWKFIEVVRRYPLHRRSSVALGLVLDTRKRFWKALSSEPAYRAFVAELVEYVREHKEAVNEPEVTVSQLVQGTDELGADDVADMRRALLRCDGLTGEDVSLLMATEVLKQSIPQFMREHGLATGDPDHDKRVHGRLRLRKFRAKKRLLAFLKQR